MSFCNEYHFSGLTRTQCAEIFSVTERTIRNWERKGAPAYASRFLLLYQGRLDFFGKAWKGFRVTPECLESPEGDFVYPGEVRGIKYLYQSANINRFELCDILDEMELLKSEIPLPEDEIKLTQLMFDPEAPTKIKEG